MFLQTTVIDKPIPALFENASIGNPITTAQNWRSMSRTYLLFVNLFTTTMNATYNFLITQKKKKNSSFEYWESYIIFELLTAGL